MNPLNRPLWEKIESFAFDTPGTKLTFAQRLARENGWSLAFTRKVLVEYKRFVFLAMAAGFPVCPSDAVDQAWHMHLTYTRSYWDDFCKGTLGRPLHHGPTRGGREEDVKHHDMYARTFAAYRQAFGEEPPADVWHPEQVRFGEDVAFRRVNTRRNWVIPKPFWLKRAAMFATGCIALLSTGCLAPGGPAMLMDMVGPEFLTFFVIMSVGVFIVASIVRAAARIGRPTTAERDTGDDPYLIATLNGGGKYAVNAAVIELARRDYIHTQPDGSLAKLADNSGIEFLHPFERAVYDAIQSPASDMPDVRSAVKHWVDGMIEHLRARGLVMQTADIERTHRRVRLLLLSIPAIGIAKILTGISRDRPVAFLVILVVVACIGIVVFLKNRPFRSKEGDALMRKLHNQFRLPGVAERSELLHAGAPGVASVAILAALYGPDLLAGTDMAYMNMAMNPKSQNSSGCSGTGCGGGCGTSGGDSGGGGDGGGSSGCGGCGGGGGD